MCDAFAIKSLHEKINPGILGSCWHHVPNFQREIVVIIFRIKFRVKPVWWEILNILKWIFTILCVQKRKKYVYLSVSVCHHPQQARLSQHLPAVQLNNIPKLCTVVSRPTGTGLCITTDKQAIMTFSVSPLAVHWCMWETVDPIVLPLQRQLHMWVTLKRAWSIPQCGQNHRWRKFPCDEFTFTFHPGVKSTPFSLFLITLLPPPTVYHLSYSFGIAVWHLALARHSPADDQRPPITRIYGSISLQLII